MSPSTTLALGEPQHPLHNPQGPITTLDLDFGADGYVEGGDLATTGGNLYLHIDGQECASLLFTKAPDGTITVTLGHFLPGEGEWAQANPITTQRATG